jgi:hypothetical protein
MVENESIMVVPQIDNLPRICVPLIRILNNQLWLGDINYQKHNVACIHSFNFIMYSSVYTVNPC